MAEEWRVILQSTLLPCPTSHRFTPGGGFHTEETARQFAEYKRTCVDVEWARVERRIVAEWEDA